MARILSKTSEWELYIPGADNERDLYAVDPDNALSMEIRLLAKQERERFVELLEMASSKKDKSRANRANSELARIYDSAVRDIKNYELNGIKIVTGKDLWEVCDQESDLVILQDVTAALVHRSRLESGLAKKLAPPSVTSTSRQPRLGGGGAPIAINQSSQGSAEISTATIPSSCSTMTKNDEQEIVATSTASSTSTAGTLSYQSAQKDI